mmetsp:Transcript_62684/g.144345  ORF Transcript_62684/g.144345 Transcript_62684/m.144345 type:complete len:321 (+) Transcript_62684:393-1355(+)
MDNSGLGRAQKTSIVGRVLVRLSESLWRLRPRRRPSHCLPPAARPPNATSGRPRRPGTSSSGLRAHKLGLRRRLLPLRTGRSIARSGTTLDPGQNRRRLRRRLLPLWTGRDIDRPGTALTPGRNRRRHGGGDWRRPLGVGESATLRTAAVGRRNLLETVGLRATLRPCLQSSRPGSACCAAQCTLVVRWSCPDGRQRLGQPRGPWRCTRLDVHRIAPCGLRRLLRRGRASAVSGCSVLRSTCPSPAAAAAARRPGVQRGSPALTTRRPGCVGIHRRKGQGGSTPERRGDGRRCASLLGGHPGSITTGKGKIRTSRVPGSR